eukprot:TRINITY_DN120826_c0_g1_i1.p1 TRINITY_DN120826_c0_g1~~TRINITY_DN120826_c0_g1_i1.p1  ORF type:complete len:643 (-),score=158.47 TRINITY_DN120826_c0_g1_i1:201-2129(-)
MCAGRVPRRRELVVRTPTKAKSKARSRAAGAAAKAAGQEKGTARAAKAALFRLSAGAGEAAAAESAALSPEKATTKTVEPSSPAVAATPGGGTRVSWRHLMSPAGLRTPSRAALQAVEEELEQTATDNLAIVVPKRQRLTSKQPPVLAIEVYRTRLTGKQAPPRWRNFAEGGRGCGPKLYAARGHYDVLGIKRTATAAEVHAAYRRRARITHPDKGGDANDFHKVVAAFEELADEGRRAAYDRNLDFFGRKDGMDSQGRFGAASPGDEEKKGAADAAPVGLARFWRLKCMATEPETWPESLAELPRAVLECLRSLLVASNASQSKHGRQSREATSRQGSASEQATKKKGGNKGAAAAAAGGRVALGASSCISRHGAGYRVDVPWGQGLVVQTGVTKSVGEALDWQASLMYVRGKAQARIRKESRGAEVVPMSDSELLELLQAEPDMEGPLFVATIEVTVKRGKKKYSSPPVPDLDVALNYRTQLLQAAAATSSRKQEEAVQREKRKLEAHAKKTFATQVVRSRERILVAAVTQELHSRSGYEALASSPAKPRRSTGSTPGRPKRKLSGPETQAPVMQPIQDAGCTDAAEAEPAESASRKACVEAVQPNEPSKGHVECGEGLQKRRRLLLDEICLIIQAWGAV